MSWGRNVTRDCRNLLASGKSKQDVIDTKTDLEQYAAFMAALKAQA